MAVVAIVHSSNSPSLIGMPGVVHELDTLTVMGSLNDLVVLDVSDQSIITLVVEGESLVLVSGEIISGQLSVLVLSIIHIQDSISHCALDSIRGSILPEFSTHEVLESSTHVSEGVAIVSPIVVVVVTSLEASLESAHW